MHLVIYMNGQLKQLWTPVTWAVLIGAGYGLLRLVVDVMRAIAGVRRAQHSRPPLPADAPSGLVARERWKAARRHAGAVAATDDPDAPPIA